VIGEIEFNGLIRSNWDSQDLTLIGGDGTSESDSVPFPVSARGVYFNGTSAYFTVDALQLNLAFTWEIWARVLGPGCVWDISTRFYADSGSEDFMSLCFTPSSHLAAKVTSLQAETISLQVAYERFRWSQFALTVDYSKADQLTKLRLWIDMEALSIKEQPQELVVDDLEFVHLLGAAINTVSVGNAEHQEWFHGFLYSLKLASYAVGAFDSPPEQADCPSCPTCPKCLSNCGADEYPESDGCA
jgi:hypothetical protein